MLCLGHLARPLAFQIDIMSAISSRWITTDQKNSGVGSEHTSGGNERDLAIIRFMHGCHGQLTYLRVGFRFGCSDAPRVQKSQCVIASVIVHPHLC